MSIRVVSQDGSSEKLLVDKLAEAEEEDEDESLASLLGITEKDVVNLDDDDTEKVDCPSPLTDSSESQTEKDEDDQKTTAKEDEENITENTTDVNEIEPDVGEEGDTVVEISNDDDEGAEKEEKRESILDFKKLFGFDRESSSEKQEPQPGTSNDDNSVHINDENVYEHDWEKVQLITPSEPNKSGSVRPVPGVVLDRRKIEQSLMKKEIAQRGKLLCGIVIIVVLLCMALGLMALAWWFGMEDLFIIGGIFGGGAVIFFVVFVFIRCSTNPSVEYMTLYKTESPEKKV